MALEAPEQWSNIRLNQDEKQIFAEAAHEIRFGETENGARPTIQPLQLLKPRRFDDHGDDLWRVFNVAQEHVICGGDHGLLINERGQRRRTSTSSRKRDRPRRSVEQGALVSWRENGGAQESRLNRKKKGEGLTPSPFSCTSTSKWERDDAETYSDWFNASHFRVNRGRLARGYDSPRDWYFLCPILLGSGSI